MTTLDGKVIDQVVGVVGGETVQELKAKVAIGYDVEVDQVILAQHDRLLIVSHEKPTGGISVVFKAPSFSKGDIVIVLEDVVYGSPQETVIKKGWQGRVHAVRDDGTLELYFCHNFRDREGESRLVAPDSLPCLTKVPELKVGTQLEFLPGAMDEGEVVIVAMNLNTTSREQNAIGVICKRTGNQFGTYISSWSEDLKFVAKATTKFGFTTGQHVQLRDSKQTGFVTGFTGNEVKVYLCEGRGEELCSPSRLEMAPSIGDRVEIQKASGRWHAGTVMRVPGENAVWESMRPPAYSVQCDVRKRGYEELWPYQAFGHTRHVPGVIRGTRVRRLVAKYSYGLALFTRPSKCKYFS